jgi:hypothetical protein
MITETRLEIHEMKRRDWRLFYEALPMRETCTELQRELKQFAQGRYAVPTPDIGIEFIRRSRRAVSVRPYRVGPFQIERFGRWGIVLALDPAYAVQRKTRRRRKAVGGLDVAFEVDFQNRLESARANFGGQQ